MKSSCVPAIRLLFCTFSNHSKNKVRNHQVRPHRFQWPLGFKRWSSAERWRDWRPTSETRIRPCLATAMLPGKHHLLMVSSGSYFSRTVVDSRGCTSGEKSRNFFWMTVPDYPSSFPASRFPASRAFPTMVASPHWNQLRSHWYHWKGVMWGARLVAGSQERRDLRRAFAPVIGLRFPNHHLRSKIL